jgi:alpha-ribazole phosphatase
MTRLYLIRHGQVEKPRPRTYNGQLDVPLSLLGREQMERLADWAVTQQLSAIYASDLQRARIGAEMVGRRCGLTPVIVPALREKHFGQWEGLTYDEASRRDPDVWEQWIANPPQARPPGGETYVDVEARVLPALQQIIFEHGRGRTPRQVLLLAHGGVNRVILCHALGVRLLHVFRIEQDYAALNSIEYTPAGDVTVRLLNGAVPGDPLLRSPAR